MERLKSVSTEFTPSQYFQAFPTTYRLSYSTMDARQYDVAVVGGGVIGLAVARAVAHTGASCVVVEARDSCIDG